jgi:PAS domain-containing protein
LERESLVDDDDEPQMVEAAGPATARLHMVIRAGGGLGDVELLRLGLQQAVAELSGIAGMVHLLDGDQQVLRLVATTGLTRQLAGPWEYLRHDADQAPAQAVAERHFVWLPAAHGRRPLALYGGGGVAAVPLPDDKGSVGVLSVVTATPHEPRAEHRAFLTSLAATLGELLGRTPTTTSPLTPAWWQEPSGSRLQQAMHAVRVGTWEWLVPTGELRLDNTALDVALGAGGIDPAAFDGRMETWTQRIHPDDMPGYLEALEHSLTTGEVFSAEYRMRRDDGSIGWFEVRGHTTFGEHGEPLWMSGTGWETTQTHIAQDSVAQVLRHMSDGFLVLDGDWRIVYANAVAERLFGPGSLLAGRVLWDAVPDIARADFEPRFRGAMANSTPAGFDLGVPTRDTWYRLRLVPVPPGLTLYVTDVTEARRAERAGTERAAHIQGLTVALAEALTARDVVHVVARHVLPLFGASGLLVQTFEDERFRVAGTFGYPPEFAADAEGLNLSPYSAAAVNRDLAPRFISASGEFTRSYPQLVPLTDNGRHNAWAFLPLTASGQYIGHCVLAFDERRAVTDEERTLMTALSGLVAQALERARLYDAEHARAQQLQRGLLPRALPTLPGIQATARYLPAGGRSDVGGDWYDARSLSGGRIALVIGDVKGHGLQKAITMGRLRTTVRTLADLEFPPDELLDHLGDLVGDFREEFLATCLYAVYDPADGRLTFANAGHPPPAVVRPDGHVEFAGPDPGPPLGLAFPPFGTTSLDLPTGSLLCFYTAGLVWSPGVGPEKGMNRLAKLLARTVPDPTRAGSALNDLCELITSDLVSEPRRAGDGAALLLVRTERFAAQDVAVWPLPEDPIAAGEARGHVRDQLVDWGLDDLVTATELIASELVGNVIRHARGPIQLRLLHTDVLICEVCDGSQSTPHIRRAAPTDEGGRGLQLVAALCNRWGARFTQTGKCIWADQKLPCRPAGDREQPEAA